MWIVIRVTGVCLAGVMLSGCWATAKSRVKPSWTLFDDPATYRGRCVKVTNEELILCRKSKDAKMKDFCHRVIRCWQIEEHSRRVRANWPL